MKKTEFISFRTTSDVKEALCKEAEDKKWSVSQLVEIIVHEWVDAHAKQDPTA